MTLDKEYLKYPKRQYGMDHNLYDWSILQKRKKIVWPNNAKIAIWISYALEFFPLNQPSKPFKAPGGMVTPYPDLRHFTTRDYGNRVGISRIWKVLTKHNIRASAAVNSEVAKRYPYIIKKINDRDDEIIAHGVDMGKIHFGDMDDTEEINQIKNSVGTLRALSGQKITGWWSPAKSESWNTCKHLAANKIEYTCDWCNDDMPYKMNNDAGNLWAMPHGAEIWDRTIIMDKKHNEDEFVEQVQDAFNTLYEETEEYGGRVLSIVLTPYIMGLHYRIKYLDKILQWIKSHDKIWNATGDEILNEIKKQT